MLSATGCKKSRARLAPPGPLVRSVHVDGNEGVQDEDVVEHLNLQPTSPVTLGSRSYYLPGLEDTDAAVIKEVYASEGYYDAEVTDVAVQVRRAGKPMKRQRAHVRFSVVEGPPTLVRSVSFDWTGTPRPPPPREPVQAVVTLKPGDVFSAAALTESRDQILASLLDQGYAFAQVTETARVDADLRVAEVHFEIDPHDHKTVSSVEVRGLDRIREALVLREFERSLGKPYSPRRLREIEAAIYGLGVFSTVSVHVGAEQPGSKLEVIADVREGKMQRVKLGVGLQIDLVRWQQHGVAEYQHHNLFKRLYRFTARGRAGYAELPAIYQPDQHGPIADLNLELRKKGLLEPQLVWSNAIGIELGIWDGYQFYTATNRFGVSRFFTRYFELGLSYNNQFTDFFAVSETLNTNRTVLGLDYRDPYFLAYFQVAPTIHLTDTLVDPSNGIRLSVPYDIATTFIGGQFDYHKIEPDLRGYYRPHPRVQLALRARLGMIVPYGQNPGAPFNRKFYLGGSNDVRGWPLRRLAPRVVDCDEGVTGCPGTPVGGYSMLNGSFELRVRTVSELWVAGFTDMGDIQQKVATFDTRGWMYSTGGGLRYDSPIGKFRLDFGWRLNDDPRFPEPRRWAVHFGLGESF